MILRFRFSTDTIYSLGTSGKIKTINKSTMPGKVMHL